MRQWPHYSTNSFPGFSFSILPPILCPNGSTFVPANFLADTFCSNSISSSPYVLPLGSGSLKYTQITTQPHVPAQKKAVFAPQFQAASPSW